MTAKDYLGQTFKLDMSIREKQRRIDMLKSKAVHITHNVATSTRAPKASNSPFENAVCEYADLQAELEEDIRRFCALQREIAGVIGRVADADRRTALEYRYLSMCAWAEVAERMNYCERHILRIHKAGLEDVEAILAACPCLSV